MALTKEDLDILFGDESPLRVPFARDAEDTDSDDSSYTSSDEEEKEEEAAANPVTTNNRQQHHARRPRYRPDSNLKGQPPTKPSMKGREIIPRRALSQMMTFWKNLTATSLISVAVVAVSIGVVAAFNPHATASKFFQTKGAGWQCPSLG